MPPHRHRAQTVTGGRRVYPWAKGRYLYFAMRLSRPFASAQLYADDQPLAASARSADGNRLKLTLHYPDAADAPLLVKVGLSAVSADNALANLDAERPDFDFARVHAAAVAAWEKELGRVRIDSDDAAQRRIFYTALYHSLIAPTLFSDTDGRYRGMDLQVHQAPAGYHHDSTYSLWDTYRALHPLLTLGAWAATNPATTSPTSTPTPGNRTRPRRWCGGGARSATTRATACPATRTAGR